MATVHVGCLLYDYQAIDVVGPCDLLNSCGKHIANALTFFGPVDPEALQKAPDSVFHHIGPTLEPVSLLTSGLKIQPTTTVDDCPELDCLLIGGPAPVGFEMPPKYPEFIQRHVAAGKLVFTSCTGAAVAAAAGVLDGKHATINNVEYEWAAKQFPKWIVDGNIWTGSGAVAAMDMVAHWVKENFGMAVLVQGCLGLDYEPRDSDGLFTVLPPRYDESGNRIATHVFRYHS
ncbi:hypothetical protein N7470_003641 [Penicillium chermesinum]|nr:hypothetical protein N7470_003641 [Penicillium chermesinum]